MSRVPRVVVSLIPCRRACRVPRYLRAPPIFTNRTLQLDASHGLLKRMSEEPVIVNKVDLPVDEAPQEFFCDLIYQVTYFQVDHSKKINWKDQDRRQERRSFSISRTLPIRFS